MDHETGQLCKNFWEDAAECHNDFDDINNSELLIINNNNDDDFDALMKREVILVDLEDADNMTAETLRKKVMTMIKVRQAIKQNMQVSGTHSNRVLDFLDVAINKTKGARMLNRLGVYYFYIRAEEYSDLIDAAFQPFLCDSIKGSTIPDVLNVSSGSSLTTDDFSDSTPSKQRKRKEIKTENVDETVTDEMNKAISAISQESKTIAEEMKRSNDLEEVKLKIEIAKALGDADMLCKLLQGIQTNI